MLLGQIPRPGGKNLSKDWEYLPQDATEQDI